MIILVDFQPCCQRTAITSSISLGNWVVLMSASVGLVRMEYSIMQVPTTQLAKMSIDLKFVEVTADVLEIFFIKYVYTRTVYTCVFF